MRKQFLKFLIIGVFNTLAGWLVYWFMLQFAHAHLAYFVAFVIVTSFSWYMNSIYTFNKDKASKRDYLGYFLFYACSYCAGVLIIEVSTNVMRINDAFAIILVSIALAPINFLGSRYILKTRHG